MKNFTRFADLLMESVENTTPKRVSGLMSMAGIRGLFKHIAENKTLSAGCLALILALVVLLISVIKKHRENKKKTKDQAMKTRDIGKKIEDIDRKARDIIGSKSQTIIPGLRKTCF